MTFPEATTYQYPNVKLSIQLYNTL